MTDTVNDTLDAAHAALTEWDGVQKAVERHRVARAGKRNEPPSPLEGRSLIIHQRLQDTTTGLRTISHELNQLLGLQYSLERRARDLDEHLLWEFLDPLDRYLDDMYTAAHAGDCGQHLCLSVQTGGGVRDGLLLDDGVERIVIGSAAIEDPDLVRRLADAYPQRVAVGLDHWDGEVRVRGWEQGSGRRLLDVASELALPGVAAFVVTDISRDATLVGPDLDGLGELHRSTSVPVIASGGVGSLDDLVALRALGVAGVIVGKAIYEGRFGVDEAVLTCAR